MLGLLYARADDALSLRHEDVIGLGKL